MNEAERSCGMAATKLPRPRVTGAARATASPQRRRGLLFFSDLTERCGAFQWSHAATQCPLTSGCRLVSRLEHVPDLTFCERDQRWLPEQQRRSIAAPGNTGCCASTAAFSVYLAAAAAAAAFVLST